MAHRVAELMEQAEKGRTVGARENAKTACSNLILCLWEKRAHLPYGAPLAPFADFLEHFVQEEQSWFSATQVTQEPKTWSQALPVAKRLLEHELGLWRDAALAAQPHAKARKLIRKLKTDLDPDESRILQSLADAGPRYEQIVTRMFGDSPAKPRPPRTAVERETAFRNAISNAALQRVKLLQSIAERGHRPTAKRRARKQKCQPREQGADATKTRSRPRKINR
jgi:hypothetical protein